MSIYSDPADVCNAVLSELGYKRRIGDLGEGSPASKMFLDWYGQARDEELSRGMGGANPWPFSVVTKLLGPATKTKTTDYAGNWDSATQPPPPWQYEWELPTDYLQALNVFPIPTEAGIQYEPKPKRWAILNDNETATLVTQFASPILVYIARVVDLTQWDVNLTAQVIANLKVKAVAGLAENPQLLQQEAQLQDRANRSTAVQP